MRVRSLRHVTTFDRIPRKDKKILKQHVLLPLKSTLLTSGNISVKAIKISTHNWDLSQVSVIGRRRIEWPTSRLSVFFRNVTRRDLRVRV